MAMIFFSRIQKISESESSTKQRRRPNALQRWVNDLIISATRHILRLSSLVVKLFHVEHSWTSPLPTTNRRLAVSCQA
jgi:hypothetical protein